ncbi:MAG: HypC/HybG/HupF family hydrogenase formation chaperone [Desulfovibrionaceae bacterium]|nr:HypC/HybG/HupF family hydrogenase formation chaperone [Desulfovibrionaceae bacterium]
MCLAIPTQITELLPGEMAKVKVGNSNTFLTASLTLLPEEAKVGDYVIVHAGFAINIVPKDEATQTLTALKEFTDAAIA